MARFYDFTGRLFNVQFYHLAFMMLGPHPIPSSQLSLGGLKTLDLYTIIFFVTQGIIVEIFLENLTFLLLE